MWWKILIAIITIVVAFNALIAYSCCVVGASADKQADLKEVGIHTIGN